MRDTENTLDNEHRNINPYTIDIPEKRLTAIMSRVEMYDWNQIPDTGGWRSGVGLDDLRRLVTYWRDNYNWRNIEKSLNKLPHFTTHIEGECIHFIRARGDGSKPPLLLLHGWPGSFLEFEKLIAPLTADGHDVIVPSLPGFAFSNPITDIIGPPRAAELMHGLMVKLFDDVRYVVQGGDWGANIACWMAYKRPDALLGIHLNMVSVTAENLEATTRDEKDYISRRDIIFDRETAYSHIQETRPQTLGVAMADSPVGSAAWILEKFGLWADLPKRSDGSPDLWRKFSENDLITNIMLYIAPPAMVTATWIYQGKRLESGQSFPSGTQIQVPTGVASFPDPVFIPPPRSFVEKTYNNVVQWTEMDRGGHFAALEQPDLLLADLRTFITTLIRDES